jgi:hypothetical protein
MGSVYLHGIMYGEAAWLCSARSLQSTPQLRTLEDDLRLLFAVTHTVVPALLDPRRAAHIPSPRLLEERWLDVNQLIDTA